MRPLIIVVYTLTSNIVPIAIGAIALTILDLVSARRRSVIQRPEPSTQNQGKYCNADNPAENVCRKI